MQIFLLIILGDLRNWTLVGQANDEYYCSEMEL